MQRRQGKIKDDPVEEIHELYNEIKDQEKKFKKVIEITCKYILYLANLKKSLWLTKIRICSSRLRSLTRS